MGTLAPFWGLAPTKPEEIITRGLDAPAPVPIGAAGAVVSKTITKHIVKGGLGKALLLGGAGFLAGTFLGGGGGQTVSPEQKTTVTPEQKTEQKQTASATLRTIQELMARLRAAQEVKVTPTVTPTVTYEGARIEAGGDVYYTGARTFTETITQTGVSQEQFAGVISAILQSQQQRAAPTQTVTVTPTQTTEATKADMGILGLIAVAGIALFAFMKGDKK